MLKEADVLVVGAGPAGVAAATAAANAGCRVMLLDDNRGAGGQIWRRGVSQAGMAAEDGPRARALAALQRSGAELLLGHRVYAAPRPHTLQALHEPDGVAAKAVTIRYGKLVLATGARERFLPFPGWTLPGVFGAGGLQALVAGGYAVAGKRVVVAGSGPLLLAVAAHLRSSGAVVSVVAEQAPLRQLLPFSVALLRSPGKIVQGLRYRLALARTRYRNGCWPAEALAHTSLPQLRAVRLTDGRRTWEESCDLLACGFHLVPNSEVPRLLGCALEGEFVQVNGEQQTSVEGVFCAGEPTGIAGLDAALTQGTVAGRACAGLRSPRLMARAQAERRFGERLAKAFALRPELRTLPRPETLVCRCEDVPLRSFAGKTGWTDAKLQSRCGMGSCQGRVCGPAVQFLLGWTNVSVRPPLFPVPLHALSEDESNPEETV